MMRSLFSAVSGLKAHQTKMDVIGNNIANVNTVAYKSQSVTFSEVYYQTTQTATGPNADTGKGGTNAQQIGLGSSVGSISTAITTEGSPERTDNPWNLSLSGDAFFVVNNAGNTYFTRAGDFTLDKDGSLVTSSGANVMGWQVDANGNVVKDQVSALHVNSPEFAYTSPQATKSITLSGNLDTDKTKETPFSFEFFDSLGNSYTVNMKTKYDATNSTDEIAKYTLTGSTITMNGKATSLTVSAGASFEFNAVSGLPIADTMKNMTFTITDDGTNDIKNIGTNTSDTTSTFTIDATGITMYKDESAIKGSCGTKDAQGKLTGAGKAVGKMNSAGIDEFGRIVASYSNGDTRTIGQIAVTTFSNPAGLEKIGNNLYASTLNSGTFDGIGQDVSATDGKIKSGYLEMSNVDLAAEFTSMITTQRGYQANSRIITVSDTLLEELINLKR